MRILTEGETSLLKLPEVAAMLGVHRTTIGRIRKADPTFPAPVRVLKTKPRWQRSDIETWIQSKKLPES